jgi:hypothetical protein
MKRAKLSVMTAEELVRHFADSEKFGNAVNFRGFPHLPGNDFVVAYAVPGEPGHDGSSLRSVST